MSYARCAARNGRTREYHLAFWRDYNLSHQSHSSFILRDKNTLKISPSVDSLPILIRTNMPSTLNIRLKDDQFPLFVLELLSSRDLSTYRHVVSDSSMANAVPAAATAQVN